MTKRKSLARHDRMQTRLCNSNRYFDDEAIEDNGSVISLYLHSVCTRAVTLTCLLHSQGLLKRNAHPHRESSSPPSFSASFRLLQFAVLTFRSLQALARTCRLLVCWSDGFVHRVSLSTLALDFRSCFDRRALNRLLPSARSPSRSSTRAYPCGFRAHLAAYRSILEVLISFLCSTLDAAIAEYESSVDHPTEMTSDLFDGCAFILPNNPSGNSADQLSPSESSGFVFDASTHASGSASTDSPVGSGTGNVFVHSFSALV